MAREPAGALAEALAWCEDTEAAIRMSHEWPYVVVSVTAGPRARMLSLRQETEGIGACIASAVRDLQRKLRAAGICTVCAHGAVVRDNKRPVVCGQGTGKRKTKGKKKPRSW